MTYSNSSSFSSEDMSSDESTSQELSLDERAAKVFPQRKRFDVAEPNVDYYNDEEFDYKNKRAVPRGKSQYDVDWDVGVDYFPGCNALSDDLIDALQDADVGDFDDRQGRLPCTIMSLGGTDEEAFVVNELDTSLVRLDKPNGEPISIEDLQNLVEIYPGIETIINAILEGKEVVPPDPFGPCVPTYNAANANVDEDGVGIPQFRLCECINYAYQGGWGYVDYTPADPYKGPLGSDVLKVRTVPFGPPQSRNNETHNPGRFQMYSERCNSWFKQEPRKFIFIHPNAEEFSLILGTDPWQSGPSNCDIFNDDVDWGEGIWTAPGGKNAINAGDTPAQLQFKNKNPNKIMLFSMGHTFENLGGVEGQEYGCVGVSGWMIPDHDLTTEKNLAQNYHANVGIKYLYTAYRFDSSINEIFALIAALARLIEGMEDADESNQDTFTRGGSDVFTAWYLDGTLNKLREKKFSFDSEADKMVIQLFIEHYCKMDPRNEGKTDLDVDYFINDDKLFYALEQHGELSLLDLFEYAYPRTYIPERIFDVINMEFDVDKWVEWRTDDEEREHGLLFEFLMWAFREGATNLIKGEDDDFIATWDNTFSFTAEEFAAYYNGGWFDACVRSGGQIYGESQENADGRVICPRYNCIKHKEVETEYDPDEPDALADVEYTILKSYELGENYTVMDGVITEHEIDNMYDPEYGDPSDGKTRGGAIANTGWHCTEAQAAAMHEWDAGLVDANGNPIPDLHIRVYPAAGHTIQPNWSEQGDVANEGTYEWSLSVPYVDENGRNKTVNEMEKLYNFWNSNDDHEFGITIFIGKKKDSKIPNDWVHLTTLKGCGNGGLSNIKNEDARKYPDYHMGKPNKNTPRYGEYKYFRVAAFTNRRKVTLEDGTTEWRGEKVDPSSATWKGGRKARVKIWPNTTGLRPAPEDFVPQNSGPAYWTTSSDVYYDENIGGIPNNQDRTDWTNYPPSGPLLYQNEHKFVSPCYTIPVQGNSVYEIKRITSGSVQERFPAPDLTIHFATDAGANNLDAHGDRDSVDFHDHWTTEEQVLPSHLTENDIVRVRTPDGAKHLIFGALNAVRDLTQWSLKGEPWAVAQKVPNTRFIEGPLYWADDGYTKRLPPFNDKRWVEQLNRFVPYVEEDGPIVNLEVGKRYKLKRPRDVGEDNRTPYDVSVIQILNDDASYPRRNRENANMRGDNWKQHFHVEPRDFTQTMNEYEFDCLSEHIVFGAYGHTRPLGQWSVNGEPVYFILEEVKVVKGPRYWANQQGTDITPLRQEAMPVLDDEHWTEPNNPLDGYVTEGNEGNTRPFINGHLYEITAVNNTKNNEVLQGADLSLAWGLGQVIRNIKTEWLAQDPANTIDNLDEQNEYPHGVFIVSRKGDADDYALNPLTRDTKTVRVEALGGLLYFGQHNMKIGYERTLTSFEKGGEEFSIYAKDLGAVDHPHGPVYHGMPAVLNTRIIPHGNTYIESSFWLELNTDYRTLQIPTFGTQDPIDEQYFRIRDTEYFIKLTCGSVSPRDKKLTGKKVYEDKSIYFYFLNSSQAVISDEVGKRWMNFKAKIHWHFHQDPGGKHRLYSYITQAHHEADVLQVKNNLGVLEDAILDPAKHTLTTEQEAWLNRNFKEDLDKERPDAIIYNGNAPGVMLLGSPSEDWITANMLKINYADQPERFKELLNGEGVFWENHDYIFPGDNCERHLSFMYNVYDGQIPSEMQSWSRKGFPRKFSTFETMGTMGASYYAEKGANPTNDPEVGGQNCEIDFKNPYWDDLFTDARYDAGIKWKIEMPDGTFKRKGQIEDRDPYNDDANDDTPWATFRPGKTYRLKLTKNSNCAITPVIVSYANARIKLPEEPLPGGGTFAPYAYPDLFDRKGEGGLYNVTGHPFTDGSDQGGIKVEYLRDKTLKHYNTNDLVNDGEEVEITMPEDGQPMLFFACHTFDTARTNKLHRPSALNKWAKYGEITELDITYVGMKDKGPVYYASDENLKKVDDYPGEIDFGNDHWIMPWNAFDPEGVQVQTNKCYEISLIPFEALDRDIEAYENYQTPPLNRPEWTEKFSLWFFDQDRDKKLTNFERGFYLEPTPQDGTILEEEPIELDGAFTTTPYRWVAQFRAQTDNLIFGVYNRDSSRAVEGGTNNCVSLQTHEGKTADDKACSLYEWSKKGAPGKFYIREIPDPDAEVPDGWAYWADTNEGKDGIDWYNAHWSNPLRTVAPDRVAGGRWYRIKAHKDIPPNYFYRLWWSADENGDDKNYRDNEYYMIGERASKCVSHDGEPGNVIRSGRTIEFYLPGKHLFFAAYNVNDRNRLEEWNRDAEPAPVLLEEIDTPDWVVRGSSYFAEQRLGFFPDFTNEYWQQINQYKKHAHKFSYTDPNTNVTLNTSFPALELKSGHIYRFRDAGLQLGSQGMRTGNDYDGIPGDAVQNPAQGELPYSKMPAEEVNSNIWHFFDNYVWMTDNRAMLEPGSGNRESNWDLDGIIARANPDTKQSTPYYDLKKAMRYVVFGTDTGAPSKTIGAPLNLYDINDWSPFGNPFLCQIEDLGEYDKIKHGPAYWAENTGGQQPDFGHDKWLNPLNYGDIVDAGGRYKITLKSSMAGKGSYRVWLLSDVNKHDLIDENGFPRPLVQIGPETLNYDMQFDGKRELEFTVPTGGEPFYHLLFGAFRQPAGRTFDNWSIDGEPVDFELEELGDIKGPGYYGDDRAFSFNVPDFKDDYQWEEVNAWGNTNGIPDYVETTVTRLTKGNSYRLEPIKGKANYDENTNITYRLLQHDNGSSMLVGPLHDPEGITVKDWFGPNIRQTDLKSITAVDYTFGTENARKIDGRTLGSWSSKGEPVPFKLTDLGKVDISGPGYWAPSNGIYRPDWNNTHWLSPLNDRLGPGNKVFKVGKRYTFKTTERTKGILHIFWIDSPDDLYTHVKDNNKFHSADEPGQTSYIAWDVPGTPKEITLRAGGTRVIFGVFGQADRKSLEEWSRDGEPVIVEITEYEEPQKEGPLYWGDIIVPGVGYEEGNILWAKDTWWEKPFRTVPESKVRPLIGGGAKITYQTGKTRPHYDVDIWFAKDRSVLSKDRDLIREGDLIFAGRWSRFESEYLIKNVVNQYMLFSTTEAPDREQLEDWSSKGEPFDVTLESYEKVEGPTYWANYDRPPTGYAKGQPNFNESHWKQIYTLQYFANGYFDWNVFDESNRVIKAPFDLYIWEMETHGVPDAQLSAKAKQASSWSLVAKIPKGSRRNISGMINSKRAQVVVGAMRTERYLEEWSPYGEPPTVGAMPSQPVEGPLLYAAPKGTPHVPSTGTLPDYNDKKWWKPFKPWGRKRLDSDPPAENGYHAMPLAGGFEYLLKLKHGSGTYKIKTGTFMSVSAVNEDFYHWEQGMEGPGARFQGQIGFRSGGKKSSRSSSSRKGNNTGGGSGQGGGSGLGDRGQPGKKLTTNRLPYAKNWLMMGQYDAAKPYTKTEWSPMGHPVWLEWQAVVDIPTPSFWLKLLSLLKRLLQLLTQIPNLISLFRELDILIEQNIKMPYDELDYSKNADLNSSELSKFCRWTHSTPLYFNTVCDETNRALIQMLKLRFNGVFIHATCEATAGGKSEWRKMNIMNMTPTFSHGMFRMTNGDVDDQKTMRILRYYSNNDQEIVRPWGREHENFFRVDTRMDPIPQKATFSFKQSWFNPQLAYPHKIWAGHYYKVLHDTQYKSASGDVTVGGYAEGEYTGGNTLDQIFYKDGFSFNVIQGDTRASDINCSTWEIMAGADKLWPDCGPFGLPKDDDDPTQVPSYFWPGVQFDFKYTEFSTIPNSKDIQILNFYLYFLDQEDKVIKVKMYPEKTSDYLFRDHQNSESKDSSRDLFAQKPDGTQMRLWAENNFKGLGLGDSRLLKITITAYMKGASRSKSAFGFNISNLTPLSSPNKIPNSYLIRSKADLQAEDPGEWPGQQP